MRPCSGQTRPRCPIVHKVVDLVRCVYFPVVANSRGGVRVAAAESMVANRERGEGQLSSWWPIAS